MKKNKLIKSFLLMGGFSCGLICLYSITSCGQGIWDAYLGKWEFTFDENQIYDSSWETTNSNYQNPMEPKDYRSPPYSNKGNDNAMLKDISRQLTKNSMVNATIRTARMEFNYAEGYRINDISLNVKFDNSNLLLHWLIHVTWNTIENTRSVTHHQISELYTLHRTPLCYAIDNNRKPLLRFGMWGSTTATLAYWHYDLYDDIDSSKNIHAKPMQNPFYMYPTDWTNTHLPTD